MPPPPVKTRGAGACAPPVAAWLRGKMTARRPGGGHARRGQWAVAGPNNKSENTTVLTFFTYNWSAAPANLHIGGFLFTFEV
jgi:hypothetical protein